MTKVIYTALFLLVAILSEAQEFQGKAEYFWKRIPKKKIEKVKTDPKEPVDPEFEKVVKEAVKKASEKQYTLTFNKTECLYEEEKALEKPSNNTEDFSVSISYGTTGNKYLNLKEQTSVVEDNVFDKEFLIVEPLVKPDWKLIDETKKIGDYNCFKAELVIPVSEKQKQDYEDFLKRDAQKPALFKMAKPEDKIVTVWYTPEIPVSFGPDNYWGLPGLILEVNDGFGIFLCTKVTLSTKEKFKIKVPNKGEKVSQKKFDEIRKKKEDSMKDEDGVIYFQH